MTVCNIQDKCTNHYSSITPSFSTGEILELEISLSEYEAVRQLPIQFSTDSAFLDYSSNFTYTWSSSIDGVLSNERSFVSDSLVKVK